MKKASVICICTLFVLALTLGSGMHKCNTAYANGVIVTELEDNGQKKPAPKKPKKAPKPKPAPKAEVVEVVALPHPLEQALILLDQRYFTRATKLLLQIVEAEPLNADAWYALGRAYRERGFLPEAQRAFRRTLEIDPSFSDLSRFLDYPAAGERQPLWDPSRPAKIEEIPVAIDGFTIMPPSYEESSILPPMQHELPVQLYQPAASPLPPQAVEPPLPDQAAPSGSRKATGVPVRVVQPGEPLPPAGTLPPPSKGPKDAPAYTPPAPPQEAPAYAPPAPDQEVPQTPDAETEAPAYIPPSPDIIPEPAEQVAPPADTQKTSEEGSAPTAVPPQP